jgi:hypothetical protein
MIFDINEENKDIDNVISYLESLIVQLRKSNKLDNITKELIQDLFNNEIAYYMTNYYLPGVETNSKYEEQIINNIIDLINILKKIL